MYLLVKYLYTETKKNRIGFIIESAPNACCYAKDSSEQLELLKQLQEMGIIDFELHELGTYRRVFGNIKLSLSAYMKFESGIDSTQMFKELFMEENKYQNINIQNNSGNIAVGSKNTQNIMLNKQINEKDVIKELLSGDIEMDIIDKIRPEIKELVEEYNKEKIDKDKMHNVFTKLKKIGGNILLSAFSFLSKPEVIQLIEGIRNNF